MAAKSVGQIGLDLVVNKKDFDKQMGGIQKLAKNAAKLLASAFAVKKIVDFGRECLELGSDLAEVQNVVDVTFPAMSRKVDEFAQGAAGAFGLSETMAKQFTGTFGAMAKAFGFSEEAAYDMSTALTGLAGDVASFYNLDQEAAYTKLKSVFTGETESLKDLGIVMTQTALDSYALANGFGKTTTEMTEAEKVALRYKFVQEQLAGATGDFARTSGGWANQVRILSLQFDSLKATIGQGLINLFTPVIKVINTLVGKLMLLASAFRSLTEMITGSKGPGMASDMEDTAQAAGNAAAAVEGVGDAAAAGAKKAKRALAGFDSLQTLDRQDGGGGTGAAAGGASIDFGTLGTGGLKEAEARTDSLLGKWKELAGLFRDGFTSGMGDAGVFDSIRESASGLVGSLAGILGDGAVAEAARGMVESILLAAGRTAGASISIGASIADNLLAGISGYVEGNADRIRGYLISMLDIAGKATEIRGNLSAALAEMAGALRGSGAKEISGALMGTFADAFMGLTGLAARFGTDLYGMLAGPFIDNSGGVRQALEDTFSAVAPIFGGIRDITMELFDTLDAFYENHMAPMLQSFREGFTGIGEKALELYRVHIVPALEGMSEKFGAFREQLSPVIEKFGEFAGKVTETVTAVWENALRPFLDEFMSTWAPAIGEALEGIWGVFVDLGSFISTVADAIMDVLGGVLDFVTGVFTGDWNKAWGGIKDFFGGIWDGLFDIIDTTTTAMASIVETAWTWIKNFFSGILDQILYVLDSFCVGLEEMIEGMLGSVSEFFCGAWEGMKQALSGILDGMKEKVSAIFSGISSSITGILTKLKASWTNIWTGMKAVVVNVFNGIWGTVKKVVNSIIGGVESMANALVRGINTMVSALNTLHFDIPDWVPALGGKSFGFDIPAIKEVSIPRLAQGAYVKPNTPQLAMIGDNRHQGEVVAPEDKIYQVSARAMWDVMQKFMAAMKAMAGTSGNGGTTIVLKVTGEMAPFVRMLKAELDRETNRGGINLEVVYE